MGLYTKTDKQRDNYYEGASINNSLSEQNIFQSYSLITFRFYSIYDY